MISSNELLWTSIISLVYFHRCISQCRPFEDWALDSEYLLPADVSSCVFACGTCQAFAACSNFCPFPLAPVPVPWYNILNQSSDITIIRNHDFHRIGGPFVPTKYLPFSVPRHGLQLQLKNFQKAHSFEQFTQQDHEAKIFQ